MRLQELREERKISQSVVADILEVTRQAYSRYERGERELGYAALIKLAKFFDVSVDFLLGNSPFYYPDSVKNAVQAVDSDEETLMRYFRSLNDELKGVALETLRVLAGIPVANKK